jgi:hypothetical protein
MAASKSGTLLTLRHSPGRCDHRRRGRAVKALVAPCRSADSAVVLDTNASLTEATAMYESAGYLPTERYNDNPYAQRWFRKTLEAPSSP